jgi:hypothetical protein
MFQEASSQIDFDEWRHQYSKNGVVVPHVTQILAAAGRCSWEFIDEEIRLHSTKRGKSVHWLTQLEDEGALNYRTVPLGLRGYRKAWNSWKKHSGFTPLWIERKFISQYGFAGTIDRAGSFPASGKYGTSTSAVLDIKSGPIYDWVRLQLVAYSLGVDERPAIARTIRRIAVRLDPYGTYQVKEWERKTWDRDFSEFMQCLRKYSSNTRKRG